MDNLTVSVLIPTFNRAHYISQALESIFWQTVSVSEILVVNDGSTDRTLEVLNGLGTRIRYLNQSNKGRQAALNHGLRYLIGDLVWIFDDDDIALSNSLELRLKPFYDTKDTEFVYSGHFIGSDDKDGKIVCGRRCETVPYIGEDLFVALTQGCFFNLQGTLIRRRCFEKVGYFDESFSRGGDYDLMLRLARHCKGVGIPDPTYIFRQHGGLRGPAHALHSSADRDKVWMLAEQRIGTRIRNQFPLECFVTAGEKSRLAPTGLERLMYLRRMASMASKGLLVEAIDDLVFAVNVSPNTSFTADEATLIKVAIVREFAQIALSRNSEAMLRILHPLSASSAGREALRYLFKGLLWGVRQKQAQELGRKTLIRVALKLLAWSF